MAITGHRSKGGENSCGVSLEGRDYTAELWVDSDDPEDTGHTVIQYLIDEGFVYGTPYNVGNDDLSSRTPVNTYLYQIEPPTLAQGSATLWSVTLRYRMVTPELNIVGGSELATTPYTRRPVVSTSTVTREKAVKKGIYRGGFTRNWEKDKERVFTNSADDVIYPPIVVEYQNRLLRVVRGFPAVIVNDTNMPLAWINSVDFVISDRVTTIHVKKYQMKLLNWATEPAFEDGYDFVRITFEGEIKKDGWRLSILDEGFNEKRDPDYTGQPPPKKSPIRIEGQGRLAEPVLLDGNGSILNIPPATIDDAKYGEWSVLDEIDPRTLGFFAGIIR